MGNPLWVSGVSGNPAGKKKGARRNVRTTIARFLLKNSSLKELQTNYNLLKPGREKLEFVLKLMPYHISPVQADSLSADEIEMLYKKLEEKLTADVQATQKIG